MPTPPDAPTFAEIRKKVSSHNAKLVAVSKTKPVADIMRLYALGQRDFGENRVQELLEKQPQLPDDIRWHLIGHLQRNKVKMVTPFVHLIQSLDSPRLLREIEKRAASDDRIIPCLLQFKIAEEDTKYGFDLATAKAMLDSGILEKSPHIEIRGVMGMATFTEDEEQVKEEFSRLRSIFEKLKTGYFSDKPSFREISMGMSGDYLLALEEGSTMVRLGTLLFGAREDQG